jgi:hypothetical protein
MKRRFSEEQIIGILKEVSGPAHCCDVTDLYQAFSQRTGPGRLWISLDSGLLSTFH